MSAPTSLPLSQIINVAVVVSPPAVQGPAFNQALIVGSSTVIPSVGANSRIRLYLNLAAMITDGFMTTSPEYLSASIYFGQQPQPTFLWIGRQDLTAIGAVAIGGTPGTGYHVNDIVTVVQSGGSFGQVLITTIGGGGAVTGISIIQGSQGTGYAVATNLATTGGNGTGFEVNITAIGESPLQSVVACRLAQPAWYCCMFVGTATDSDVQAIAGFIEAVSPLSVYFQTTGEAAVLNGSTPNILATLQAENFRRTFSVYSTTQGGNFPNNIYASAAPMGLAMGLNTRAAGSYFDLMFKQMSGISYEPLTQSQANAIGGTVDRTEIGLNGNILLNYANGSYTWMQSALMANGTFFDQVLQLDMLASDMQTAGVNLLTSVPSLPITDPGVLQMKNALRGACLRSQAIGFIAPSGAWNGQQVGTGNLGFVSGQALPEGFALYAAPVSTLSAGQRSARILPAITVLVIEAQSAHSLSVTVNVQQ